MIKKRFSVLLLTMVLTLAIPLRVRADVIAEPGFLSLGNPDTLVLVVIVLIGVLAVCTAILVRVLGKRKRKK